MFVILSIDFKGKDFQYWFCTGLKKQKLLFYFICPDCIELIAHRY